MKIAMANDHAGTALKNELKALVESRGHEVVDFGTYDDASCDLSDFVYPAALAVGLGEFERGIFVDGVGYGSALIANRILGVTAVVCQDPFCARLAREHTDSNVLCLGGKIIGGGIAADIVDVWLTTDVLTGDPKYGRRIGKVDAISRRHLRPLDELPVE